MKQRNTKQKQLIQEDLDKIKTFFSAKELYRKVKKRDKSIGIATVYRFLNERKKENRIFSYLCDRRTIYSTNTASHCHFMCEETGKVVHFKIESLDFLKKKIPGSITSFQLEVKGICSDCM